MTLPALPDVLNCPLRAAWNAQSQDPRQQRAVDAGPPGTKRRWSSVARGVQLEIEVGRLGKAVFEKFYRVTTQTGSLPFTMQDPTTHGWPLLASDGRALLGPDGTPILLAATWVCKFGQEMPSERLIGARFQIAFPIWVMP